MSHNKAVLSVNTSIFARYYALSLDFASPQSIHIENAHLKPAYGVIHIFHRLRGSIREVAPTTSLFIK
jgi:hypothetical protein